MQILVEDKCKIIKRLLLATGSFFAQLEESVKAIQFIYTGTAKLETLLSTGTMCENKDAPQNVVQEKLETFWEETQKARSSQAVFKKIAQDKMSKAADSQQETYFLCLDFYIVSNSSVIGNWNMRTRGSHCKKQ